MVVDGNTFLRRAQKFFIELQANRYPNSTTLANLCSCSTNTAQRTIYRLRDEYLVPLDYDKSEKGYYLVDRDYSFPTILPPGKDEYTSLLLARDLVATLDAEDLVDRLDSLWQSYVASNSSLRRELGALAEVFSSDATVVGEIADNGVLQFVQAASAGESVKLVYKSPWRHTEEKTYKGKIERVHFSDGSLYLLFNDSNGNCRVLNASFIKEFEILDHSVDCALPNSKEELLTSENWLAGFGVWAGEELHQIEIHILPPAAEYYAAQRWHAEQEDHWQGKVLVRKFPAMISPELVRRVLSVGKHVLEIKPAKLKEEVTSQIEQLIENLS